MRQHQSMAFVVDMIEDVQTVPRVPEAWWTSGIR